MKIFIDIFMSMLLKYYRWKFVSPITYESDL